MTLGRSRLGKGAQIPQSPTRESCSPRVCVFVLIAVRLIEHSPSLIAREKKLQTNRFRVVRQSSNRRKFEENLGKHTQKRGAQLERNELRSNHAVWFESTTAQSSGKCFVVANIRSTIKTLQEDRCHESLATLPTVGQNRN